jgi:hypothetical protein
MADPSDAAGETPPPRPSNPGAPLAARLATDHLIWIALFWLVLAFVLRPAVLAAHHGDVSGLAGWIGQRVDGAGLARTAGMVQWGALAGLILLLTLAHVRVLNAAPVYARTFNARFGVAAAYAGAFAIGYVAFVWTPVTAVSLMMHDTFIFFDAMQRIEQGQRPSIDFPTALGAAMLYLPWLAAKLVGGYAGAIELASAFVALLLCLACAQACAARHGGAVTALLVAAVFLIVVPSMLEGYDAPRSVTLEAGELVAVNDNFANAMFYNRWGWGALIAVFAFLTPRRDEDGTPLAEIITLGLLLVFLFWLKISYFAIAAGAAVLYAYLGAKPWRTLMFGAGGAAAGIALIGLLTGNLIAYVADILAVGRVSGLRFADLASLIKDNMLELLVALAPMLAMALLGRLRPTDLWVTGMIFGGTLFIINQNAQTSGLPTMLVASAYAIWRLRDDESRALRLIAAFSLALPAATYVMDRSAGLLGQTTVARREEARPEPAWAVIPAMKNVFAQERESILARIEAASDEDTKVQAFRNAAVFGRRQYLRSGEYMASLMAAMADLQPLMKANETVVDLDFASPLAFLTGTRAAEGYWITFDDGRTIDGKTFPKPEALFADADHVMSPKLFVEPDTAIRLRSLYSGWLDAHYAERVETPYWVRWSHRRPLLRPATQMALIP